MKKFKFIKIFQDFLDDKFTIVNLLYTISVLLILFFVGPSWYAKSNASFFIIIFKIIHEIIFGFYMYYLVKKLIMHKPTIIHKPTQDQIKSYQQLLVDLK